MITIEPDLYATDLAISRSSVAAATGDGVTIWAVTPTGLRRSVAREYNINIGRVAATDGGWVLLTMRGSTVDLLVTDENLMPKYSLPLPRIGEPWEFRQIGNAVGVFARGEREARIIKRDGVERVVWPRGLEAGGVAASDSSDVIWATDGTEALRPVFRTAEPVVLASSIRVGRTTIVVTPEWKAVMYALTAVAVVATVLIVGRRMYGNR